MKKPRICIISTQIFSEQKLGGFGSMTKSLARSLVAQGYEVVVVVPKKKGGLAEAYGFKVLGLSLLEMFNPRTFRKINADIYHSQNPSLISTVAILGEPQKKHVITCRDPRNFRDWLIEIKDATWKRKLRNLPLTLFEEGPLIAWTMRRVDRVAYHAYWLKDKIRQMYRLKREPIFLPNIEEAPKTIPLKAKKPIICFVGRFDGVKRPELFIKLAGDFPQVDFLMVGKAEEERRQKVLERMARGCPNLKMLGYIDKFDGEELYEVYNRSWILVNTSSKEALSLALMEAAGRGCAILSYVNPDNFASRFGFWAKDNNFKEGLAYLLENNRWKEKGRLAHDYVYGTYRAEKAIDAHLKIYKELLEGSKNDKNKKKY